MSKKYKNIEHCCLSTNARKVAKPYTEAQLKGVFRCHSSDQGGHRLSRKDVKNAFSSLGSSALGWRAIRALCHADKNRDGFIDEEELDNLVRYAAKRSYTIKQIHISLSIDKNVLSVSAF